MRSAFRGPSVNCRLNDYAAERQALLQRIHTWLERDPRVQAAWLWGSLGRGEGDQFSDLDLWIVVDDAHADSLIQQRYAYVAQDRQPLLTLDAFDIWPIGGAYLLALYAGNVAPLHVDWYWQTQSAMLKEVVPCFPYDVQILVERVTLPRCQWKPSCPGSSNPPRLTQAQQLTHAVSFFWCMVPIVAKYVARSPERAGIELLSLLTGPLSDVSIYLGAEAPDPLSKKATATTEPGRKLTLLRQLTDRMESVMPALAAQGIEVPRPCVAPQVRQYLDLVECKVGRARSA